MKTVLVRKACPAFHQNYDLFAHFDFTISRGLKSAPSNEKRK